MEPHGGGAMLREATFALDDFVAFFSSHSFEGGIESKRIIVFHFYSLHHDFLTVLSFQNQGEQTNWVGGMVYKGADRGPGVTGQVY